MICLNCRQEFPFTNGSDYCSVSCEDAMALECSEAVVNDEPNIGPKFDSGKLRYDLVPTIATKALAEVLTFGCDKYAANSWQDVPDAERRYTAALMRHFEAYRSGEHLDSESKLSHLKHSITNLAFLLHFEQERINKETT